jgi:hypothetical protein
VIVSNTEDVPFAPLLELGLGAANWSPPLPPAPIVTVTFLAKPGNG